MRPAPPAASEDAFRYGWRYVKRTLPDGKVELDQVPLSLEDVLHPEEGDFIVQNMQHDLDCTYLAIVFRSRPLSPPLARVTHDLRIDWGVLGLRAHGPDIGVFVGMHTEPAPSDGTLHLAQSGGRCVLVVEVVSPDSRDNDAVTKVDHYHQASIPLYVLIDQKKEGGPRSLLAYRWQPQRYQEAPLDGQGRLLIPELGLHLSVRDDRAVCHDAATGRELGDYARVTAEAAQFARQLEESDRRGQEREQELEQAILSQRQSEKERHVAERQREEAERQREEADLRTAEAERHRQDAERQKQEAERQKQEAERQKQEAERQARDARLQKEQEARAREEAENQAREQTLAREDAERRAQAQTRAREEAERLAQVEARAREDLEARLREMEAALRRLQQGPSSPPA
jgi:hypothetical protein